jgi:hypothetical protein
VDLNADAKNCGKCGHDCLGGTCDLGVCQPFTVASNQSYLNGLVTDGTYVYWTGGSGGGAIHYVARRRVDASDSVKVLAPAETGGRGLTLSGTKLYWVASGHVRGCDAPDCAAGPSDLIPAVGIASCGASVLFAPQNQTLYWACSATYNMDDGMLWSLALPAVTPVTVGMNPSNPVALASDSSNLYWLNSSTYTNDSPNYDGAVIRARFSDGAVATLVPGLRGDTYALAVQGTSLFFAGNIGTLATTISTSIFRAPLPNGLGSAPLPKFADALSVGGMVADSQYLYFTDNGSLANFVARCPLAACPTPEVIAPGQNAPTAITQDTVSVYWIGYGPSGSVQRIAK